MRVEHRLRPRRAGRGDAADGVAKEVLVLAIGEDRRDAIAVGDVGDRVPVHVIARKRVIAETNVEDGRYDTRPAGDVVERIVGDRLPRSRRGSIRTSPAIRGGGAGKGNVGEVIEVVNLGYAITGGAKGVVEADVTSGGRLIVGGHNRVVIDVVSCAGGMGHAIADEGNTARGIGGNIGKRVVTDIGRTGEGLVQVIEMLARAGDRRGRRDGPAARAR